MTEEEYVKISHVDELEDEIKGIKDSIEEYNKILKKVYILRERDAKKKKEIIELIKTLSDLIEKIEVDIPKLKTKGKRGRPKKAKVKETVIKEKKKRGRKKKIKEEVKKPEKIKEEVKKPEKIKKEISLKKLKEEKPEKIKVSESEEFISKIKKLRQEFEKIKEEIK